MDFDEFDNLSKRNVKLILKIFSHLEPLGGLVEQKNVVFNSFLCNLRFFGTEWTFKTLVSLEF
jgi:hypothetical protein